MTRARRFRVVSYGLAALLVAVAFGRLVSMALPLIDPVLSRASFTCEPCRIHTDPIKLLDMEPARAAARRDPAAGQAILERSRLPHVRHLLFLAELVAAIPFIMMLLGIAVALRSFAKAGFNAAGIRWLRRSAAAALAWVLASQVSLSIRMTAFSPITDGRELRHIVFDADTLVRGLMIAGVAWVVVWVIEEAFVLQRDLEQYV